MTVGMVDRVPNGRTDVPLRPNGEPVHENSDYDPRFCQKIIELAKEGKSLAEWCTAIDISKRKANQWRRYEEWDEAMEEALTAREAFLNAQGARNIEWVDSKGNPQFRSEVWKELKADHKPVEKVEEVKQDLSDAVKAVQAETQNYLDALHKETI